jgi:hypothetical protein
MTDRQRDELLLQVAAEHESEDRAAAEEEVARERLDARSHVFSVRLSPEVYDAVRDRAESEHLTPTALIRQWVSERIEAAQGPDDPAAAVASLRREVERVARLVRPTGPAQQDVARGA